VQPAADRAAAGFGAPGDKPHRPVPGGAVPGTAAAAGYTTSQGADEPVGQRSQLLLLPVHDLSRRARAERVPPARYPVGRKGRGARAAENRGRATGGGTTAVA